MTQEQIFDKLTELAQDWPTIDFDTFDESQRYEGVYYTRGIGEAAEEWIDDDEICAGDLVDVTIYWHVEEQWAELLVEPYED